MKKLITIIFVLIIPILPTSFLYGEGISIVDTEQFKSPFMTKKVPLLKLNISPEIKQELLRRLNIIEMEKSPNRTTQFEANNLPDKVELGMNGVPPLDQGLHGSCVTFAVTEAIDAAFGKGDYISQLCSLALGQYLSKHSYWPSGWNGSNNIIVLQQIQGFGVINKEVQKTKGCAGLTEYPIDTQPSSFMTIKDFHKLSESVFNIPGQLSKIQWSPIFSLTHEQLFNAYEDPNMLLYQVKKALAHHQRVVLGFMYDLDALRTETLTKENLGKYQIDYDTLILTPKIIEDIKNGLPNPAGHEVVVTGYDDNAIAYSSTGEAHRGLLMYRNSVGAGLLPADIFMSYDYFKALADEASQVGLIEKFQH